MAEYDIVARLRNTAEKWADRTAIEWCGKRTSYADLDKSSNAMANRLASQRVGRGSIVAVLVESIPSVISSIVGILKTGAAFVLLDPAYPVKRLRTVIAECTPQVLLVDKGQMEKLLKSDLDGSVTEFLLLVSGEDTSDKAVPLSTSLHVQKCREESTLGWPAVVFDPDDMCYICFTSGSTGRPKGVAGRYKGLGQFVSWETRTFQVDETYRISQLTSPAFDPFLRDVFVPLCSGGTVCVPDSDAMVWNPKELIAWIDRSNISLIHCVPTIFRAIVNEGLKKEYFSSLKYVLIAGEQLFGAEVKKWQDVFKSRVQLVNLYGPTETTLAKFYHLICEADADRRVIPVGMPIEGARAAVVNDDGVPCLPGVLGEIVIRTPFCSLGYFGRPELTDSVFVRNPFSEDPNDLIYKTGDIGKVGEDGTFELLGRMDQQVKVRGVRIELGEIEGLLRAWEGIVDVAVVEKENSNGDKWLCSYIVADRQLESSELRQFLSGHLPVSMLPAAYVKIASLPMTGNGKVDRRALRARRDSEVDAVPYVAPRSPLETALTVIWQKLLGLERVGIHDNFFAIGGHSLLATRVMAHVSETLGVEVPLQVLFESPTVAGLSLAVAQIKAEHEDDSRVVQLLTEIEQLPESDIAKMLKAF